MISHEINFDGIVGPTHNYAGLSWGNIASMTHAKSVSNPKQAALEGLEKMKFLSDLGVKQAVLPPHERPHIRTLRALGFCGSDADVLAKVKETDPKLLAAVSSASAMWAANAATVSPSADSLDQKVHFTPANLISTFHRSLEAATTARILKAIFLDDSHFVHHDPLADVANFADEGAANHTRLFSQAGLPGVQIFTFGRSAADPPRTGFPARQTLQASEAIARLHCLNPHATLFVRQAAQSIDAGAFHNDVVGVGHQNVLLIHASAWEQQPIAVRNVADAFATVCGGPLHVIEVTEDEIGINEAIATYLFNSQIVTLPDGSFALIAPVECAKNARVRSVIDGIIAAPNPISAVHYVDVRQSMHNGGGPACLRLRAMLNEREITAMHTDAVFTETLYQSLKNWIDRHYRDYLSGEDLADPKLLDESRTALHELTKILRLPAIYDFQQ